MATSKQLRAQARAALQNARPFMGDEDSASEASTPNRVGDVVAVYSAPVEPEGQIAQAALGAGSVTDDLLRGGGSLIDKDALGDALDGTRAGVYSVLLAFDCNNPTAMKRWTQRDSVEVVFTGDPSTWPDIVARAIQTRAREIVKEDSDTIVTLIEAVIVPEGETLGVKLGRGPALVPDDEDAPRVPKPRALSRSERATLQPRGKGGKFVSRNRPKRASKSATPASAPKSKSAPKSAKKTTKRKSASAGTKKKSAPTKSAKRTKTTPAKKKTTKKSATKKKTKSARGRKRGT